MPRRVGRPGLVGTMARTAVVAGTATAVHGAMTKGSKEDAAAAQQAEAQAAQEAQVQMAEMQGQLNTIAAQQAASAAPAEGGTDMMAELQKLADLKGAGLLTDEEFSAAKAKVLAG